MPTESVVFSPTVDERQLDREVDKTNKAFADAGEIDPSVGGDLDLGDMGASGVGDGGGGKSEELLGELGGEMGISRINSPQAWGPSRAGHRRPSYRYRGRCRGGATQANDIIERPPSNDDEPVWNRGGHVLPTVGRRAFGDI